MMHWAKGAVWATSEAVEPRLTGEVMDRIWSPSVAGAVGVGGGDVAVGGGSGTGVGDGGGVGVVVGGNGGVVLVVGGGVGVGAVGGGGVVVVTGGGVGTGTVTEEGGGGGGTDVPPGLVVVGGVVDVPDCGSGVWVSGRPSSGVCRQLQEAVNTSTALSSIDIASLIVLPSPAGW